MTVVDFPVHYVQAGDVRIAYHEAGEGRPLLMVHGNFASKRWFAEQLANPPPGWRIVAPDLPNFGDSEALPESVSIEAYARYLHAFVQALDLPPFVLVGHSLGGAVAQVYATEHPETLLGLVLVAAPPPGGFVYPEELYPVLESLKGDREALAQALGPTMAARRPPYFGVLVDDALKMHPDAYTGNGRALGRYDVSAKTERVTCPILVVRGALDLPHLVSEAMARATAASYANARLELPGHLGHSPQLEDPVWFNRLLRAFLEGLP
jgi:pimeloyl-ACP methyl ester carboxylesterase